MGNRAFRVLRGMVSHRDCCSACYQGILDKQTAPSFMLDGSLSLLKALLEIICIQFMVCKYSPASYESQTGRQCSHDLISHPELKSLHPPQVTPKPAAQLRTDNPTNTILETRPKVNTQLLLVRAECVALGCKLPRHPLVS